MLDDEKFDSFSKDLFNKKRKKILKIIKPLKDKFPPLVKKTEISIIKNKIELDLGIIKEVWGVVDLPTLNNFVKKITLL